jgi:hypothetical protein
VLIDEKRIIVKKGVKIIEDYRLVGLLMKKKCENALIPKGIQRILQQK